jgi:nitrogen fixation protein NifU and related proteins
MEDPLYREIILEHWQHPQNFGVIEGADFDESGNNPLCGDQLRLTGKVEEGKLTQIAFTGQGCAISRASASLLTERIEGQTIEEIGKLSATDVLDELGLSLTPARMKCALLVYSCLRKVVEAQ